ncbi:MAG: aldehyde dehydrogenase family protein [Pirellulales bacterium]
MSAVAVEQQRPATNERIDRCLAELTAGRSRLTALSLAERMALLEDCLARVARLAPEWVDAASDAKGLLLSNPLRAEEITAGPVATARHLQLLIRNFKSLQSTGRIELPAPPKTGPEGALRVQVMPVKGLYDTLVFAGFRAEAWLAPQVTRADLEKLGQHVLHPAPARCVLVLGAGNVSSIPATDTISKVFQEGHVVLLKMNPVNDYLGPIFERLFAKLIEPGFVRIIYGGAEVGSAAVQHPQVDEVHITGSIHSHDAIVWGPPGPERERRKREHDPLLKKPITSELGNVSPWIIVPGPYTAKQLAFQAENVASSIVNNASFNCVATKMIVTAKSWPQRGQFLDLLQAVLAKVPPRRAYYPGARERFGRFAGQQPPAAGDTLPWTLVRDASPEHGEHLFCEESFVCVCAETGLDAADERDFLRRAVDFANDRLWGTLSAAVTVHPSFRKSPAGEQVFQGALAGLRHGAIGVNYWPALVYAMMSPPWGGYPSGTLEDAQSGIGSVHNTFMLEHVQKTVLEGPLTQAPKPLWFPTHRRPEALAWKVLDLYTKPSLWKLPGLMLSALGG